MFALTGNLRLRLEAWWFAWQLGTEVLRERELGTVMALEARRNLVLKVRLLVDNGLRESR